MKSARFRFSISPHKNVWTGFFETDTEEKSRLIYSTTPGETALFTDSYRPPKKKNVQQFFEKLSGHKVSGVQLATGDRYLSIDFDSDYRLLFQPFGHKANLFLLEHGTVIDSFKNQAEVIGTKAPEPRSPKPAGPPPENADSKTLILHYDKKFPRQLIGPVIEHFDLKNPSPENVSDLVDQLTNSLKNSETFRVLNNGDLCLLPEELLPLENLNEFSTVNDAIRFCYYKASRNRRFNNRLRQIKPGLEKILEKNQRTLDQLEGADKALERAEKYEKFGHLLMTVAHKETDPANDRIEVDDPYDQNRKVTISIDSQKSIAENAQNYYERSSKAKKRIRESKRRYKETTEHSETVSRLLESLENVSKLPELENWMDEHSRQLADLGLGKPDEKQESRPFITREIDGYDIWIGKNAASNDEVTSRAHKEDMWLHAREVSGSHVIIRMNNSKDNPPGRVVQKAASYAAWHSKLRGSDLVPVIVTKKKYVTKPKGSPPGSVRVQREDVELVQPRKP